MATYIMMSTLTDEGRKTLKERPDRLMAVNKEVEDMGARIRAQYAVLGGYDFVNVIDAPSNEIMARISMELGSRGTIKVTTLPGMPIEEFINNMKAAPPRKEKAADSEDD
ncbi:MAG: GYD domain-containing protein [Pseudomonadota bacterium]